MLIPLLWTEPGSGSLAVRGLFLFTVWGVLVVISAGLARLLAETEGPDHPASGAEQEGMPETRDVL